MPHATDYKQSGQLKYRSHYDRKFIHPLACGLTKKAEPPPTRDVNRDSGTASANGGWLRRLVRRTISHQTLLAQLLCRPSISKSCMESSARQCHRDSQTRQRKSNEYRRPCLRVRRGLCANPLYPSVTRETLLSPTDLLFVATTEANHPVNSKLATSRAALA